MFWLEFSFMWCGSVGRACYNTAYAANASKQICWALSSTKWHLLPVMAALILVCALSCWMSTDSDCQVFFCVAFFFFFYLWGGWWCTGWEVSWPGPRGIQAAPDLVTTQYLLEEKIKPDPLQSHNLSTQLLNKQFTHMVTQKDCIHNYKQPIV